MKIGVASGLGWFLVLSCVAMGLSGCGKKNPPTAPTIPTPVAGMLWIREGSFTLGSPGTEVERNVDEGPQTAVVLTRGFWMGSTEVTQGQYQAAMSTNPSFFASPPTRPVERTSWNDAVAYCATLTTLERRAGRCPANWRYRLPTEAEWEYGARAGTTARFSYGDDPGYTVLTNWAWYQFNSDLWTHPVGMKTPNAWGLFDTYGNVWEWCQDWYGPYPGGSVTDPQGPTTGSSRVSRGGSFYDSDGRYCRSASRRDVSPTLSFSYLGFRVVLAPVQP